MTGLALRTTAKISVTLEIQSSQALPERPLPIFCSPKIALKDAIPTFERRIEI